MDESLNLREAEWFPRNPHVVLVFHLAREHELTLAAFTYGEPHAPPPFKVRVEAVPWEWSAAYREMTGADPDASRRAWQHLTFETNDP